MLGTYRYRYVYLNSYLNGTPVPKISAVDSAPDVKWMTIWEFIPQIILQTINDKRRSLAIFQFEFSGAALAHRKIFRLRNNDVDPHIGTL